MTSFGSRGRAEDDLRDFARLQVRSGLLDAQQQHDEVVAAVRAEMPGTDATILARAWLAAAAKARDALAATWPEVTDFDRLQSAFAECESHGVPVLQGVEDRAAVERVLAGCEPRPRGVLRFTRDDVWRAVDHGVLGLDLLGEGATAVPPGDPLLTAVLGCFGRHGLPARSAEGRMEVAASWQRRPR